MQKNEPSDDSWPTVESLCLWISPAETPGITEENKLALLCPFWIPEHGIREHSDMFYITKFGMVCLAATLTAAREPWPRFVFTCVIWRIWSTWLARSFFSYKNLKIWSYHLKAFGSGCWLFPSPQICFLLYGHKTPLLFPRLLYSGMWPRF